MTRTASTLWDGQIVAAIYVSAALEGHYLRVLIRPYTLLPLGPDLHVADGITDWHLALQLGAAMSGTLRRFLAAAAHLRHQNRWRGRRGDARRGRAGQLSPRELYALLSTPNMHQIEDLERIIQVMETKVFAVTEEFLKAHDIDIEEYARQVQNFIVNNVVGNTVTGGTVNVAAAGRNVSGSQRGAAPGQGGQQSQAKK